MNGLIQFLAVTALGLAVAAGVHWWIGLFDNLYVAAAIWLGICGAYALIYDWRSGKTRRSSTDLKAPD
jgi:hypothetical protein